MTNYDSKSFMLALNTIKKFAVPSAKFSPLLSCVRVTDTHLEYCGYNAYAKIPIQTTATTGLDVVVDIPRLLDVTKTVKKGTFSISTSHDTALLSLSGVDYALKLGDKSDWLSEVYGAFSPSLPQTNAAITCDFSLIEKCLPFTATDDTRPALHGVYVDATNFALVASDGYRLISVKLWTQPFEFYTSKDTMLIPSALIKSLKGIKGVVQVIKSPKHGEFSWITVLHQGGIYSWTGLESVNYPNYVSFLPVHSKYEISWKADITPMLKNSHACILSITENKMTVATYNAFLNDKKKEVIASQTVNIDQQIRSITLGISPKYLQEALACCTEGMYNMYLNTDNAGVVNKPVKIVNTQVLNEVLIIVMPMGLE